MTTTDDRALELVVEACVLAADSWWLDHKGDDLGERQRVHGAVEDAVRHGVEQRLLAVTDGALGRIHDEGVPIRRQV